jgi:tetratricopeptide (TPR) repeat protein
MIEGTVRDSGGKPVAGAILHLEEQGATRAVETKTDADGTYILTTGHAGTFTVKAEKTGYLDTVIRAIVLSEGDKKHVDVLLRSPETLKSKPVPASADAKSGAGSMEFSDEPSFTIAGVTDWSNLGLHGSAASSQTSESLAKRTLALKFNGPEAASAEASSGRYASALAIRDKGDLRGAREQVQKTLAIANDAEGHRLLGELDEKLGDPLKAVREYEQAVQLDPSEQNYFEWGTELLLHKAAEPAVEVFTRGSTAHPKSARMLTGLGAALYANGSAEEAARRLCDAADLQPADPSPYLFLGKIEKTMPGPLPCSEQKLARFAREQSGNALANYYYAVSLWKHEQGSENSAGYKLTEALLEKAVMIDPHLGEAYLQLGVLHSARGDLQGAIREYREAIEADPKLGEAHRQLGMAYQRTGEKAKAQEEFEAYEQAERAEAAENAAQQKELRQFLVILKEKKTSVPPR